MGFAANLARLAQFLTATSGGDVSAANTPAVNDNTKKLVTTEWVQALAVAHGQCRLAYVSSTQLKLSPFNGRSLNINGITQQVPSVGVTVSNSGLSSSTLCTTCTRT